MANVTAFNEMFRQLREDIDNKEPYTIGPWPFGGPHQSSDLALVLRSAAAHYHAALEDVDLHMSIMMNAAEEIDRLRDALEKISLGGQSKEILVKWASQALGYGHEKEPQP